MQPLLTQPGNCTPKLLGPDPLVPGWSLRQTKAEGRETNSYIGGQVGWWVAAEAACVTIYEDLSEGGLFCATCATHYGILASSVLYRGHRAGWRSGEEIISLRSHLTCPRTGEHTSDPGVVSSLILPPPHPNPAEGHVGAELAHWALLNSRATETNSLIKSPGGFILMLHPQPVASTRGRAELCTPHLS